MSEVNYQIIFYRIPFPSLRTRHATHLEVHRKEEVTVTIPRVLVLRRNTKSISGLFLVLVAAWVLGSSYHNAGQLSINYTPINTKDRSGAH